MKFISGVFLGAVLAIWACNYKYFEMDKKLALGDLLSAAISASVGFYIADKISGKQASSRSEKDFIIKEVKEFIAELNKIKSKNDAGSIPFAEAKTVFRDLNHSIAHLQELSQHSEFTKRADFTVVRSEFVKVRKLILDMSPVDGNITIPNRIKTQVDSQLHKLKSNLFKMILTFNAH